MGKHEHAGVPHEHAGVTRREVVLVMAAAATAGLWSRGALAAGQDVPGRVRGVRAMTFDVFGTVVALAAAAVERQKALERRGWFGGVWAAFADGGRGGYGPAMRRVRNGELPWTKIDDLHRMILDTLVPEFGLERLTEAELDDLNRVWHRLRPWPDAVAFSDEQFVYDLIYKPEQTRLLRDAAAHGAHTLGGLDMLIRQAAASYAEWTGRAMPVDRVREALREVEIRNPKS